MPGIVGPSFSPSPYYLGDFEIYVDSASGNDSNSGASGSPLQTIDAALDRVPLGWFGKNRLHLAAGTYAMSRTNLSLLGPIGINAEPFAIIGTMIDSGLGALTESGGSTASVINGGSAMTVDAYRGMRIRFTSGSQNGQTRTIVGNTASSFTIQAGCALGGAPSAGSTFVIEKPGSVIQPAGNFSTQIAITGPRPSRVNLILYAVKWVMPGGAGGSLSFNFGNMAAVLDACDIDLGAVSGNRVLVQNQGGLSITGLGGSFPTISNSSPFTSTYFHHGVDGTFNSGLWVGYGGIVYSAYVVMDDCTIDVNTASMAIIAAPDIRKGAITCDNQSVIGMAQGCNIDGMNTVGALLYVRKNSSLDMASGTPYVLKNSTGDAMYVDQSVVRNELTHPSITGTGNAGYGIRLGANAHLIVDAGTTVTGTSGDIIVGATTSTHANLTSAGFVTDANYLSRIART